MTAPLKGLLVVWTDIPASVEHEFNEWYNREHMRDRIIGVPGFIRGRRFVSRGDGPKYLATYEAHRIEVMASQPYCALLRDPDPTSRRFIPLFQNTFKGICDVTVEAGEAEGAAMAVLRINRTGSDSSALCQWMKETLIPQLMRQHGVVAARYAEKNPEVLAAGTAGHLRPTDTYIDAMLMIEAVSHDDLDAALKTIAYDTMAACGAQADGTPRRFDVIYTLHVSPAAPAA